MVGISRHVARLSGYAPALPTRFRDDDTIDRAAFESLCELQIKHAAGALVVCGTTGEAPTLAAREQRELELSCAAVSTRIWPRALTFGP